MRARCLYRAGGLPQMREAGIGWCRPYYRNRAEGLFTYFRMRCKRARR